MAAPSYLVKLKFGTEVDKKAFNEIQSAYEKMSQKQKQTFAKNYNTSIDEMNKLFKKEMKSNLKSYEEASIKTEQTLTKARVAELRKYIDKRNMQMKRMPSYTAAALGAGALGIANAAVSSSFSLTQYDKNNISKTMNMGAAGLTAGAMTLGPIGALIGGAVGAGTGYIMSEFENGAEKIQRSATLFSNAVGAYRQALNVTAPLDTEMKRSGFTDEGEYLAYRNALRSAGINDDAWVMNLARMVAGQKGNEELGARLLASRPDQVLQWFYNDFLKSGLDARTYVMGSRAIGGRQLGMRGVNLLSILEEGGLNTLLQDELRAASAQGALPGRSASSMTGFLRKNEKKRKDLERNERWQSVAQNKLIENIDMNASILKENSMSFNRALISMKENELLLEGIKELYKSHMKELSQIFAEITRRTGKGTTYGEGASSALKAGGVKGLTEYVKHQGLPYSPAQPLMSRVDDAKDRINQTRVQNSPIPIGAM